MNYLKSIALLCSVAALVGCSHISPRKSASSETSYSYNAAENALTVTFKDGESYIYADVPEDVYGQIQAADSKGKAFNSLVRGKYKSTKVQ